MSRIKVAVIGVGHLGRYHAEKYRAHPGVELVGVVDVEKYRADKLAGRLGVPAFYRHLDLLDRVQAVSVAVPTGGHFDVARDCLSAGVHILVEKPITRTLDEADRLLALAEEKGLIVQVGHLERFNPALKAAARFIGRPLFIEANRISPFSERGTDVDVILDLMIHDIDIALHLVGERPSHIRAVGVPVATPRIDIANVRLEFPSGCVANLTASRISEKSLRKIRIFQKDAYLSIDYGRREAYVVRRDALDASGRPGTRGQVLDVGPSDALEEEINTFIQAVVQGTEPPVSGRDGRRALDVALQIGADIESRRDLWELDGGPESP
ncbi:MAG: Gfo/Idh/MocA family oxidoreductase [Proteobacteria bacterium]|nr:Gfo/Idh/MocA family oxidoreductase [Pseudomonadota bacterium]